MFEGCTCSRGVRGRCTRPCWTEEKLSHSSVTQLQLLFDVVFLGAVYLSGFFDRHAWADVFRSLSEILIAYVAAPAAPTYFLLIS